MNNECPHCGKKQTQKPEKTWSYGTIVVNHYLCKCKKTFNHYQSKKSSWTIPKPKK